MKDCKPATLTAAEAARLFSRRLAGFIRRRVASRDEAEDLLQEVLMRATRHEKALMAARDPMAWLFALTRSVVADHYRSVGRPEPDLTGWMDSDPPTPAAVLSDCVAPLLNHLPAKYKETLLRSDLGGETLTALAKEEGLSASALKSRAQRGRKMLRDALIASCHVELDRRGNVISVEEHKGKCC